MQDLPVITDEMMRERLPHARMYCIVFLRRTPKLERPAADPVIWEHGRRNFALREAGLMPIVCPIDDGSELAGVSIFDAEPDRVREIMEGDPGVQAGIFTYEVHPARGFPGSALPAS